MLHRHGRRPVRVGGADPTGARAARNQHGSLLTEYVCEVNHTMPSSQSAVKWHIAVVYRLAVLPGSNLGRPGSVLPAGPRNP
jgi:hypothetical protein